MQNQGRGDENKTALRGGLLFEFLTTQCVIDERKRNDHGVISNTEPKVVTPSPWVVP